MGQSVTRDPRTDPAVGDALRCSYWGRCDVIDRSSGQVVVEWSDPTAPVQESFALAVWREFWAYADGDVLVVAEVASG